jgi:hypothetical protein
MLIVSAPGSGLVPGVELGFALFAAEGDGFTVFAGAGDAGVRRLAADGAFVGGHGGGSELESLQNCRAMLETYKTGRFLSIFDLSSSDHP